MYFKLLWKMQKNKAVGIEMSAILIISGFYGLVYQVSFTSDTKENLKSAHWVPKQVLKRHDFPQTVTTENFLWLH